MPHITAAFKQNVEQVLHIVLLHHAPEDLATVHVVELGQGLIVFESQLEAGLLLATPLSLNSSFSFCMIEVDPILRNRCLRRRGCSEVSDGMHP